MGLKDMSSLYDRNVKDNLGPSVGTTLPSDGTYFTNNGNTASPYDIPGGLVTAQGQVQSDQMIELLNNDITTATGHTYLKAPNQSPYQDIEGLDINTDSPTSYLDNPPS